MDVPQRYAVWWAGVEDAVEPPVLSAGQWTAPARILVTEQPGRDAVAALRVGRGLCPAYHVGLAHRVLHRYCDMVRPVPAHQPAALHRPNRATATHQVRPGDRGGKWPGISFKMHSNANDMIIMLETIRVVALGIYDYRN